MSQSDDDRRVLTADDLEAEQLGDWRVLFAELHARFRTGSFVKGLDLVNQIGEHAELMNHHPDVDLSYPAVTVRLSSHDVGGLTQRDVRLARTISGLAASLGAEAEPGALQVLEIALDTADAEEIKPFWAAVLGLTAADDELTDRTGRLPTLWFQETEPHEEPRQRFHLDIRVPPELARDRIDKALAAGGRLVSDERAPSFWVLADAQGNKACVTTWQGRW